MVLIWTCGCAFGAILGEALISTLGLPAPLFAVTAFYFFVTHSWERSVMIFGVAGAVLDVTLMRVGFPSLVVLIPVAMMAGVWRRQGDCRNGVLQGLPGFVVGVVWGLALVLLETLPGQRFALPLIQRSATVIGGGALIGLLGLPLVRVGLDALASGLRFPRYREVTQARRSSARG